MRFYHYILALILISTLTACSKYKTSHTQPNTNPNISKVELGIGDKPTLPIKNYNENSSDVKLIGGVSVPKKLIEDFLASTASKDSNSINQIQRLDTSDFITLMNAGVILRVIV